MRVAKLVTGIFSLIFSVIIFIEAVVLGVASYYYHAGDYVVYGVIVSALFLAGGIVMIASKKNSGVGGSIAGLVLFTLAAIFGFMQDGYMLWALVAIAYAILNLVAIIVHKPQQPNPPRFPEQNNYPNYTNYTNQF